MEEGGQGDGGKQNCQIREILNQPCKINSSSSPDLSSSSEEPVLLSLLLSSFLLDLPLALRFLGGALGRGGGDRSR